MTDLRDPRVRARTCLSCHIGNTEGKVVTHPMYAAGHPALPSIEVAQFSENMPRHWYHTRDIPWLKNAKPGELTKQKEHLRWEYKDFQQTQLALVGAASAWRTWSHLVQMRATPEKAFDPRRWPELLKVGKANWNGGQAIVQAWPELAMTHFDCRACHHDLQIPSWRQKRGYRGLPPGRPTPPEWLRVLLPIATEQAKKSTTDLKQKMGEFDKACTKVPFGRSDDIAKLTPGMVSQCDGLLDPLAEWKPPDNKTARAMLIALCGMEPYDYDSAREVASLIDMIYGELSPQPAAKEVGPVLADLKKKLNLVQDPFFEQREQLIRTSVEGGKPGKEDYKNLLRSEVASGKLSIAMTEQPGLGKLGAINDKALAQAAERLAKYKPKEVQDAMREIGRLVGGK
jgi:hypothetical protein